MLAADLRMGMSTTYDMPPILPLVSGSGKETPHRIKRVITSFPECALWQAQIGVEIFQSQHVRVFETVGQIPHLFNTDRGDMRQS